MFLSRSCFAYCSPYVSAIGCSCEWLVGENYYRAAINAAKSTVDFSRRSVIACYHSGSRTAKLQCSSIWRDRTARGKPGGSDYSQRCSVLSVHGLRVLCDRISSSRGTPWLEAFGDHISLQLLVLVLISSQSASSGFQRKHENPSPIFQKQNRILSVKLIHTQNSRQVGTSQTPFYVGSYSTTSSVHFASRGVGTLISPITNWEAWTYPRFLKYE